MQVIDNNQLNVIFLLQTAALGTQVKHAQRRCIINNQIIIAGYRSNLIHQLNPFILRETSARNLLRVNTRLDGEKTVN